jgi:putative alpha-1,2-mannosidase
MSAWYIFTAMGFYPMNPVSGDHIQPVRLNGKPLDIPIATHQQIEAGGLLEFDMGPTPSSWGSASRGTPLPSGR